MSKKYRRFYETAFDSKISKSDEDLLSSEKQDAAIARRLSSQLQLSASASSVRQCDVAPAAVRPRPMVRLFAVFKRREHHKRYLSTDSMATCSSLSLESITSDSLSSHSSESPGYKRFPEPHVLSPISDKSSQGAIGADSATSATTAAATANCERGRRLSVSAARARPPQSLGLIKLNADRQQLHGSDSGISVGSKPGDNYQELLDLPFDMPKLRRKPGVSEETVAPSQLPFDMPKLRRKRADLAFDASGTIANAVAPKPGQLERLPFDMPRLRKIGDGAADRKPDRSGLFLDVKPNVSGANNNRPSLKNFQNKSQPNRPTLSLSNIKPLNFVEDIDVSLSLDQQCWYHGPVNRLEAEKTLHGQGEGSYLVRGIKGSFALSIKSAKGFIHMRITQSGESFYLGQSDRPFDTIPDLIRHYTLNRLPAKGAEHVGLLRPLAHQIL